MKISCFTILKIHKYSIHFVLQLYWIHYIVIHFLVTSFSRYKEYMICLISFNKFSDVLPAFTCASATGNLWIISLRVNILIALPFHCLGFFHEFWLLFSDFHFQFLLISFLKSIYSSLILFTIYSFFSLHSSFAKIFC